jgi:hypothetical protein
MTTINTNIKNKANGRSITISNEAELDNDSTCNETHIWVPIIEMLVGEDVECKIIQNGEIHIYMEQKQIERGLERLQLMMNSDENGSNRKMFQQLWSELKPLLDSKS